MDRSVCTELVDVESTATDLATAIRLLFRVLATGFRLWVAPRVLASASVTLSRGGRAKYTLEARRLGRCATISHLALEGRGLSRGNLLIRTRLIMTNL